MTTHINCRFQLFFKLNIITCPVQHGLNGISHSYSWKNYFLFFHMLCGITAAGINKTMNGSFFLLQLQALLCCTSFLGQIISRCPFYLQGSNVLITNIWFSLILFAHSPADIDGEKAKLLEDCKCLSVITRQCEYLAMSLFLNE